MPKTEDIKSLLIFTGGTIGACVDKQTIDVDAENSALLHHYKERYNTPPPLITCNPYTILSENLDLSHLQILISTIEQQLQKHTLKGIIITHGSDTLAYTSNLLALKFSTIAIPILLVCSDKVLSEHRANGLLHLHVAFNFITQGLGTGVYVPYKNANEPCYIHRGESLMQSFELSSRFESINNAPFMRVEDNKFIPLHVNMPPIKPCEMAKNLCDAPIIIHPYPGIDYASLPLQKGSTILHATYHSGSVPESVEILLKRAKEMEISLYFCGIPKAQNYYASTAKLITWGAKILYEDSLERAYGKIVLGLV